MKLVELAQKLNISLEIVKRFIQDFDLDLDDCLSPNLDIKPEFEKFALENTSFLQKYAQDLEAKKSVSQIANEINQPKEKIEEFLSRDLPQVFDNGLYKSSVSSFGIDQKMGGNYKFVYDYFGAKTPLTKKDFIGYRDLYFYITDVLSPFINQSESKDWGIEKPSGIILYGPPGSGKIFWAKKISEIINYDFREIKKYYLRGSYVSNKKDGFNDFLLSMLSEEKVQLFMDDFDAIMMERTDNYSKKNERTKEIVLHNISQFQQEDIVMVGSANSVSQIDEELLAPGRFDVLIPVFPPNAKERAEILLYSMLKNLDNDSQLMKILVYNNADHLPFWNEVASQMKAFSNTMVIDFTQSLKKRIRNQFKKSTTDVVQISKADLKGALRDASAKLTGEYLNQIQQFILDVSRNNADDFPSRLKNLTLELNSYQSKEEPRREIGFQKSDE